MNEPNQPEEYDPKEIFNGEPPVDTQNGPIDDTFGASIPAISTQPGQYMQYCLDCGQAVPCIFGWVIFSYVFIAYIYALETNLTEDDPLGQRIFVVVVFHLLVILVAWSWIRSIFVSPGVLPVRHMKKVAFSSLSDESKKVILGSRPDGGQGQEQVQAGDEGQAQSMPQAGPSSSVGDEDQAHTGIDTEAQTEATQPETSWETRTSSLARTTLKFEDAPPVLTEKTECTHSMEGTSEPSATNKACLERSAATDTPIKHTGTPTEVESTGVSAPNTQIMSHDIPVALDANSAHPPPAMVAPLSTPLSGDILRSASSAPIDMDDIENLETKVTFRIPASEMKLDERGMLMYLKNDDNVHCPVRTITAERGGGVRLCRIEKLVKPDRTHHCSICRRCILRYDHHCPWIHNCVGFHNHKYFYLFLLYMFLICWWVFGTTLPYTIEWFTSGNLSDTKGGTYPISLSLTIIGAIFGIMVTGLFFFHTYLICVNKTTVEQNFAPNFTVSSKRSNVFNLGVYNNWKYIMGDKVWLWFLPLDGGRSGDGLAYPLPESKELA